MESPGRIVRAVWAMCLLLAGLNHAHILFRHGLAWDYDGASAASAVYWSSLTIVDPLVAVLLLVRPRIGVPTTVVVIATNVIHNLSVTAHNAPPGALVEYVITSWQMVSQIGFLLFVLATWRIARRGIRKGSVEQAKPGR